METETHATGPLCCTRCNKQFSSMTGEEFCSACLLKAKRSLIHRVWRFLVSLPEKMRRKFLAPSNEGEGQFRAIVDRIPFANKKRDFDDIAQAIFTNVVHHKLALMHAVGRRKSIKQETLTALEKGIAVMAFLFKMLHRFARKFLGYPSGLPREAMFAI